ncbi:hypothetical protein [Alteromonas sp. P256]|uniref:hypothetical protein n=1 Tax=Alteromonas sp. P256 TaxID=3117399 RepID=UPI002FE00A42
MILLLARHKVLDTEAFLVGYKDEKASSLREKFGVKDESAWKTIHEENDVLVMHKFESEDQANAFLEADELKDMMKELGVIEEPSLQIFSSL